MLKNVNIAQIPLHLMKFSIKFARLREFQVAFLPKQNLLNNLYFITLSAVYYLKFTGVRIGGFIVVFIFLQRYCEVISKVIFLNDTNVTDFR